MNNEHESCLICGSKKLKPLPVYSATYLVRCSNCKFVFSKRIPTEQELSENYAHYSRSDYISELTIKRYNELLDRFEPFRKLNRILDVGSGVGHFLQTAKGRNWEVYGTEYTDVAIKKCEAKGIKMFKGPISDSPFENNFFDVITSFEVLEHINTPNPEIEKFKSLLRGGGIVYLTTPNFNSISRYLMKEKYNVIEYPEHLSYYTPKTIHNLFTRHGFSKESLQTTGFSVTRYKTSMKLAESAYIGPTTDDEAIRKAMEKNSLMKFAKSAINFLLSVTGKGDSLKIIYKVKKKQ